MQRRTLSDADVRLIAAAVADELQARAILATAVPAAVMTAVQVGALLGRSRDWVYEHADELGAFRLGSGRSRMGFLRSNIDRWIGEHTIDRQDRAMPATPSRACRRGRATPSVELIDFEEDRA